MIQIKPLDDGLWQGDQILSEEQAEALIAESRTEARNKRSIVGFQKFPFSKWDMPIQFAIPHNFSKPFNFQFKVLI